MAQHIGVIGERLVAIAHEFTGDMNESYLLAHKALRYLLLEYESLSNIDLRELRAAVAVAAEVLATPDERSRNTSAQ